MVVLSESMKGSSSSSSTDVHKYDVFLSFRGVDTRNGFTDHLHKALLNANISTFLDDEEIEAGGDLKPELESAIKESRASIIVLSKNYANSSWCLDELVLILKQRMTSNHIVIPIFYHVEPTHIRKQKHTFEVAMAKHKQRMEVETNANKRSQLAQKIERWSKALTEVADLKGMNAKGRRETEFIEEIVEDVYRRLHVPLMSALPLLIGMDYSIKFIASWLKDSSSDTGDILTIWGMGGIGKTSLANYVYLSHFREFDTRSYIENISGRCAEKLDWLLELTKQLCGDISKRSSIPVYNISEYTSNIEKALVNKKVFIVLDDIDRLDQLDTLLGSKGLHPGSKIIVTTRDAGLTQSCALFKTNANPKHVKHLLQGLCEAESRQLLCFHAFRCNDPKADYKEVSEKLVNYCEGHPLALEVLGKSLHNRDVDYWEGCILRLKKEATFHINNILKMSFDSLPSKNDKDLFLHIACFFVGMERDVTETILKACGIETRSGIRNLIDRCLLNIGWNDKLMMHQLIQEMGRSVVREESPNKPWERSRLWCHESFKVIQQKMGTENVLGLTLDMRMLEKEKLSGSSELYTDAFSKMDNLMLLQLNYVKINGSFDKFPKELRWLCMHGSLSKSVPLDLPPLENLVVLDMSYSNIELFIFHNSNPQRPTKRQKFQQSTTSRLKDKRLFGSLKILKLSFCEQLCTLGEFDEFPALERLIATNCSKLFEVCESIEQCVELVLIDLRYCKNLEKLPSIIHKLEKVKTLLLDGCNHEEARIEIVNMEAIKSSLSSFPRSLISLSLARNNLPVESFPVDLSILTKLKNLYLDGNPIISLPICVRSLPSLELLSLKDCKRLMSIQHLPPTLRKLILCFRYKPLLRKVIFDPEMSPLKLETEWHLLAPSSFEFQGMVKIQPLESAGKKVLLSLSWTKLDFPNEWRMGTTSHFRGSEESQIQMYYQFGIFSTIYGGDEIPKWFSYKRQGSSISFAIPPMPHGMMHRFKGLNFCFVQTNRFPSRIDDEWNHFLPVIIVSNITKNRTWIYKHIINQVSVGVECVIFLSHWMFGMNEMEGGDHITITVTEKADQVTKECGVSFVYDDGKTNDKEEDVLAYYKAWNHIIGGDLSAFQLTTGEYLLETSRFWQHDIALHPYYWISLQMMPDIKIRRCGLELYLEGSARYQVMHALGVYFQRSLTDP